MKSGAISNINIEAKNFGVEAIMWIQQVRMVKKIQEYIKNQLDEGKIAEQLELEFEDPFKKNKQSALADHVPFQRWLDEEGYAR